MTRFPEFLQTSFRTWFLRRALLVSSAIAIPFAGVILVCDGARHAAPAAASGQAESIERPAASAASAAPGPSTELSALAQLGRKMFFDPSLSGSGQLACASCHSPANAYAPANGLAVQLGGPDLKSAGVRAVPSLTYLEHTPNFTIGPNPQMPDSDQLQQAVAPAADVKVAAVAKADPNSTVLAAAEANIPQGGLDWDGRADTIQSQARGPLLDPNEMNNRNVDEVLDRLKHAVYADDMKQLFGAQIFSQPALALDEALFALVRFQLEDPSFHPYSSKYDAYLAGKMVLDEAEARGLKLFEDPKKGNCSSCHIDKASRDGLFQPAFTDYQFESLGAPRNRNIPANSDSHYYDLGLCGPLRTDYADAAAYCGLFKTPTLRNVATRKVFFHNGVFHSLDEVMHFYVERETNPGKWYPKLANGNFDVYNDLPPQYKQNVDVADAPFDRKAGDKPALNDAEIADVIAFLKTLTDGYEIERPKTAGAAQ
ncbi:cytochrome-c peroxidase [Methyloferula stellata]|uniref:cytochrome-c peroxidase n=1 Tax=Methyloferula stellata TaxID=876270 RepID=UPI00037F501A|nr:cytochrome c peroxidase [Methyloferula stellata]